MYYLANNSGACGCFPLSEAEIDIGKPSSNCELIAFIFIWKCYENFFYPAPQKV